LKISNKKATEGGFFVADFAFLKQRSPAEWLMLGSFAVYCFVFPWAMLLLSFDWMPFGMEWMSSLLLAMLGLATTGWLWVNYERTGLLASASIFVFGVAFEYLGVTTGFPFGTYRYTGLLLPQLPGGVPLAIGFAWLAVVTGSMITARWLLGSAADKRTAMLVSTVGAALAVGLDLLLEPVAYHVKSYWVWLASDGYFGIPWSNFITWLVAAFALNLGLAALLDLRRSLRWAWLLVALYGMNVALFGVVNVAHGYWLPGALAVLISGAIGMRWAQHDS
jgi:putative membrane protein